jgi:ribosomal protein S6
MKATENKTGEKMHVYEVGYLLMPTVSEDQISGEVDSLRKIFADAKAEIIAEGEPVLTTLAYTMVKTIDAKNRKYNEGYFGWIKFELPVASLTDIKTAFEKHPSVLRYLITKTVRENTMYSNRVSELEAKDGEGDVPTGETEGASQKEIDKSIDALVI